MEALLTILMAVIVLVILDGLYGSGAIFYAARGLGRLVSRRAPGLADTLGLGRDVVESEVLNERSASLAGRIAPLEQAIVGGRGRLSIDGTPWTVTGPELPAGTIVRIRKAQGPLLVVEPRT